jgi:hypothetical protein
MTIKSKKKMKTNKAKRKLPSVRQVEDWLFGAIDTQERIAELEECLDGLLDEAAPYLPDGDFSAQWYHRRGAMSGAAEGLIAELEELSEEIKGDK